MIWFLLLVPLCPTLVTLCVIVFRLTAITEGPAGPSVSPPPPAAPPPPSTLGPDEPEPDSYLDAEFATLVARYREELHLCVTT